MVPCGSEEYHSVIPRAHDSALFCEILCPFGVNNMGCPFFVHYLSFMYIKVYKYKNIIKDFDI